MCNCSSTPASICNQCAEGKTCGCPPDYTVLPQPIECTCCPAGYTYYGPTPNYPNGYCQGLSATAIILPTCNQCVDSMSSDCVQLPAIACLGLKEGSTVTDLARLLCTEGFVLQLLQTIGLSTTLKQAFCEIVSVCPVVGTTTPIIGPITVTLP
jgi:hypothetical protein